MRKKLIAIAAMCLLLTGCSASKEDAATNACVKAVEEEVGAAIDRSEIAASNMDEDLYESGVRDEKETTDDNSGFMVSGTYTYELDGTETRKTMFCFVNFEDGEMAEPEMTSF